MVVMRMFSSDLCSGRFTLGGHSTQVVSQGRHHHSRWTKWAQPWSSGLNAPAGLPKNRHRDPWLARFSIHPVMLAVAACMPSSLGVRFILDPPVHAFMRR
jgi:hypothetical protein